MAYMQGFHCCSLGDPPTVLLRRCFHHYHLFFAVSSPQTKRQRLQRNQEPPRRWDPERLRRCFAAAALQHVGEQNSSAPYRLLSNVALFVELHLHHLVPVDWSVVVAAAWCSRYLGFRHVDVSLRKPRRRSSSWSSASRSSSPPPSILELRSLSALRRWLHPPQMRYY
ncbi:hypothetical protein HAX54_024652 [Datura stramonium]|uniref:Uncharacterized protein n=1 Tax=Datura stramonium TaxID=4076 RepID=A0ABS8RH68_DATST|nr:hypothetical protein [Datura stramonium]